MTCIPLRGLGGDVDDGDAVAVGVVFAHPQFVCATTQPLMLAAVGTRPAPLCPYGWRAAQDSSWITNSIYEDLRRVLYHIVPHAIWSYGQSR